MKKLILIGIFLLSSTLVSAKDPSDPVSIHASADAMYKYVVGKGEIKIENTDTDKTAKKATLKAGGANYVDLTTSTTVEDEDGVTTSTNQTTVRMTVNSKSMNSDILTLTGSSVKCERVIKTCASGSVSKRKGVQCSEKEVESSKVNCMKSTTAGRVDLMTITWDEGADTFTVNVNGETYAPNAHL